MKTLRLIVICSVSFLALAAHAADGTTTWTLKTDDTHIVLAVRENKVFIESMKHPAQGWNWTPTPSEVPLVARAFRRVHGFDQGPIGVVGPVDEFGMTTQEHDVILRRGDGVAQGGVLHYKAV